MNLGVRIDSGWWPWAPQTFTTLEGVRFVGKDLARAGHQVCGVRVLIRRLWLHRVEFQQVVYQHPGVAAGLVLDEGRQRHTEVARQRNYLSFIHPAQLAKQGEALRLQSQTIARLAKYL